MRVLVIGAGLAGLAATERLLDAGARVTVVDSFPLPGGRVASFEVPEGVEVAGLVPGDVVEHGLHAWFQHYHGVYGLMQRAALPKPRFAGRGIYFFDASHGHTLIEGGPFFWFVNSLRLPKERRGSRVRAVSALARLIARLDGALKSPDATDSLTALEVLETAGVPSEAIENIFRPCLYSLTSLRLEELSALEMLRWMSNIIPDPRIRVIDGGGTQAMCGPIAEHLMRRGADFRMGVEVCRIGLDDARRVTLELERAPDRTGVRHILVPGFEPAEPPDPRGFDAVLSTLPWEKLRALSEGDPKLEEHPVWQNFEKLDNIHPLTIRLWFQRPIESALPHYTLASGTLFDVLRPTRESGSPEGIRLIDALVENIDTHLPEIGYRHETLLPEGDVERSIVRRVVEDLEKMYPGQIEGNAVARRFLHSREGIIACRPGVWKLRAPQHIGLPNLVLGGDWTRQPFGVCMEGAVRSGQIAADALLSGGQPEVRAPAFAQLAFSARSLFHRR
jgi:15-cis-phytoene desaturase